MITGRINPHEEPAKYQTYQGNDDDWNGMGYQTGWQHRPQTPLYAEQPGILKEAVDIAAKLGFTLGARVKRKNGIDNLGTITHIHQWFSQAWNYTNGELEPFKVTWDNRSGQSGGAFDYGIQDLELVEAAKEVVIVNEKKDDFHEGILHLC